MIFLGFIGKIFGVDNFISPEINIFNSCLGTRLQTWLRRHQTASVLSTLAETAQDFKHMVYCTLSTQARNAQDLVSLHCTSTYKQIFSILYHSDSTQ